MNKFKTLNIAKRFYSPINLKYLQYHEYGEPTKVLKMEHRILEDISLTKGQILIKFISAAIHPSDINTIQGQYANKPKMPAIGGNEGYAKIIKTAEDVTLSPETYVIPRHTNSGTWTNYKIVKEEEVIPVKDVIPEVGAIMTVNPGTAYRMLKDFVNLTKDDWVVQTGGTSAVAMYVTQLCKIWEINTLSIVRSRKNEKDTEMVKEMLKKYGATIVVTQDEAKNVCKTIESKLALNCVGGRAMLPLLRSLKENGIIISYGGMGAQPLTVPVSPLIFSDISLRGFWMSRWAEQRKTQTERIKMITEIANYFNEGRLKPTPFQSSSFNNWQKAISNSLFKDVTPEGLSSKQIFLMDDI